MAEGGYVALKIGKLQKYDALDGKTFLICIGAMKCATSWISYYLASLDGIAISPLKELHFFGMKFPGNALSDMDRLAFRRLAYFLEKDGDPIQNLLANPGYKASVDRLQMLYDDDAYFGHFARLCGPETRTFCDITPAYSTLGPDGFAYMRDFCASQDIRVRILFVMRDPVDRFWSQLRHLTQANPDADLTGRWQKTLEAPRIMARADYQSVVADIDNTFPAEDVLYLFYEDLFQEKALRQLCDFAGVAYQPGETETPRNQTELRLDLPDEAREAFLDVLASQYDFCRERFGPRVPNSWLA